MEKLKNYLSPEMELILLGESDVITCSPNESYGEINSDDKSLGGEDPEF